MDINTDLKIKIITEYITTKYPSFDFKKHGEQLNIIITDDKEPGLRKLYVNVNIFLNKCIKYSIFKDTEWEC